MRHRSVNIPKCAFSHERLKYGKEYSKRDSSHFFAFFHYVHFLSAYALSFIVVCNIRKRNAKQYEILILENYVLPK